MTVRGAGHERTVDQDVWVTVIVSVVPLNANAVAAVQVEAKVNPKEARILIFVETEGTTNGRSFPALRIRASTYTLCFAAHASKFTRGSLLKD